MNTENNNNNNKQGDANEDELKKLFKAINYSKPSELDFLRWNKNLVLSKNKDIVLQSWRLWAAMFVGFAIGVATFKLSEMSNKHNNYSADATIEHVHINLD